MTWEEYLEKMRPWIRRLVGPRIRPHPYLGRDDLMQEGLTALWETWQKFRESKPDDDLCRLGTTIMRRRMADVSQHSQQRGEMSSREIRLDHPMKVRGVSGPSNIRIEDDWSSEGKHVMRAVSSARDGVDTALLGRKMTDLDAELTGTLAQRILREVLAPGDRTVETVRRLWGTSSQRPWAVIRTAALADGLGCSAEEVRDAWRVVEARVRELLADEAATSAPVRYTPVEARTLNQSEDDAMDNAANAAVNTAVDDLMPPGMEEVQKEVENVKKAKAKKTEKAKAPKAEKADKKADKKAEKPAKVVFNEKNTLPVGAKIKCSRGPGEVTDIFYRVKLTDGKMCNVSAKSASKA